MGRNMIVERWPSRYFGDYRPEDHDSEVSQTEVAALIGSVGDVDRPLIIENVADDQDPHRIAAEFGCSYQMAEALVEYVRAGGR